MDSVHDHVNTTLISFCRAAELIITNYSQMLLPALLWRLCVSVCPAWCLCLIANNIFIFMQIIYSILLDFVYYFQILYNGVNSSVFFILFVKLYTQNILIWGDRFKTRFFFWNCTTLFSAIFLHGKCYSNNFLKYYKTLLSNHLMPPPNNSLAYFFLKYSQLTKYLGICYFKKKT